MNSSELTEADAQKLFNEVSQAVRDSDSVKLSELMDKQPPTEEEPVKDPPEDPEEEEQPEELDDKDNKDGPPEKDDQDEEDAGKSKEEEDKGKTKEEPSELEKLKEELALLKKQNHTLKSNAGRVPQIQRRLQELDKKLEDAKKASPSSQPSTKIKPKVEELLQGVKKTDPELAETIAAVIAEAIDGVASENSTKELDTLKLLRDQELAAYQEEQTQILLERYPNAADVFTSTSWAEWKKSQPSGIKALCESNNADEVSYAFEKYAADMKAKYPELASEEGEKSKDTPSPEEAKRAKQIEEERQRKKERAANIKSPNAAGKVSMPDDPQALFEKYSSEIRKQRMGG